MTQPFAPILIALAACATPGTDQVASAARWVLDSRPALQRRDCSGLVQAVLARAGIPVRGSARTFWQDAQADGRVTGDPVPGDLAFFDRTYDANRNGRVDDLLTHVAVVTAIEGDGTVVMVHYGSGQIRELRLNRATPDVHRVGARLVNDYLRAPRYGTASTPRLAGQLLRGFARPPPPVRR